MLGCRSQCRWHWRDAAWRPAPPNVPLAPRDRGITHLSLPQELQVDVDTPGLDIDLADGVLDQRDEQFLAAVAHDVQHLAGRQRTQLADDADLALAVVDGAALQLLWPPLVLLQLGRLLAGDEQVGAGAAHDLVLAVTDAQDAASVEQCGARLSHMEAAVETVRSADAAGVQQLGVVPVGHGIAVSR